MHTPTHALANAAHAYIARVDYGRARPLRPVYALYTLANAYVMGGGQHACDGCGNLHTLRVQMHYCGLLWHAGQVLHPTMRPAPYPVGPARHGARAWHFAQVCGILRHGHRNSW